ncbi:MAG: DUF4440 domain-containing protein [Gemmatimonadota bacterium]
MLDLIFFLILAGASSVADPASRGERDLAATFPRDSTEAEIRAVLEAQEEAWNRGDLEGFMTGYWESPDLVFTSGGRVQRGYATVLERYRATYGSGARMGWLSFSDLEVHALGADAAWALGSWALELESGRVAGVFTLVLERRDGAWKIVHDHTSRGPEAADAAPAADPEPRSPTPNDAREEPS